MSLLLGTEMDRDLCGLLSQLGDGCAFVEELSSGGFHCSESLREQFALPDQEATAAEIWRALLHPDDYPVFARARAELKTGRRINKELRFRTRNGEYVWMRFSGWILSSQGQEARFCGILNNLSSWNSLDPITGLPGEWEFREALSGQSAKGAGCGVLLLSVDDLPQINEMYSYSAGNRVLHFLARRLKDRQPPVSTVYRLDGPIFGVICTHANPLCMENCFRAFQSIAHEPLTFGGRDITCTVTGGACFAPSRRWDVDTVCQCARLALSIAQEEGSGRFRVYSDSMISQMEKERNLLECLRESVRRGFQGFHLRYQPLIFAQDGSLYGCEALLRWEHPDYPEGASPGDFIPILEKDGLMPSVDEWVLEQALRQCARWLPAKPDFQININMSSGHFENEEFCQKVLEKLEMYGVPASAVTLELTESRRIRDPQQVNRAFERLRRQGLKIAFDDFGMGYSALGILRVLDADELKIDRSFLERVTDSERDRQLIRQIVDFCHRISMHVCIEGIESREVEEIVKEMGVDLMQGFYFNPPLTPERFSEFYQLQH